MKKALLILVCLGLGFVPAMALAGSTPRVATIMDGATALSASQEYSGTTTTFTVSDREGFFAVQASAVGTGVVKIEFYTKADGAATFAEPSSGGDIITGLTGSSGTVTTQFSPDYCNELCIVITETGGAASVTPTVKMIYK